MMCGLRGRIALAAVATVVCLALTWLGDRSFITVGSEDTLMRHIYVAEKILGVDDRTLPDRFLAVNVGYDLQLTPMYDELGMPLGERESVNRGRIEQFLRAIDGSDYGAVLLDVFFDGDHPAPGDTSLLALVNGMERVVVPRHIGGNVSPMLKPDKTAWSDFIVNIYEDDFVKYACRWDDGEPSIAARALCMATGVDAVSGAMRQPALFLPLHVTMRSQYTDNGDLQWYNLGANLLCDSATIASLPSLVDGRIVVIGDYVNRDSHGTYVGQIFGPTIHINAIEALLQGLNRIRLDEAAVMALFYFGICMWLSMGTALWRRLRVRAASLLEFCLNFVSFSVFLVVLQIILYICFGKFHDSFLVAAFLSVYTILCQQLNKRLPLCTD